LALAVLVGQREAESAFLQAHEARAVPYLSRS
jgi:hypothetical protein